MTNQTEREWHKLAGIEYSPTSYAWRLTKYYTNLAIFHAVRILAFGLAVLGVIHVGMVLNMQPPEKPLG